MHRDLRVVRLDAARAEEARALRIHPAQQGYVSDVPLEVTHALSADGAEAMAVQLADRVIGFYRLDLAWRDAPAATARLRSLLIDRGWQGRGLGQAAIAACCADLAVRHPGKRLLTLDVHVTNVAAIRVYGRCGFVDTGVLHPGGAAGPQRVLVRGL